MIKTAVPRLTREKSIWRGYGKELLERNFKLPDGIDIDFYVLRGTTSPVIIFPLTCDRKVIAVNQYRFGAMDSIIEIPGGVIKEGEAADNTVKRELLEETGCLADEIILLGKQVWFEPSALATAFHPYLALGCRKVSELCLESVELMETILIPLDEWIEMILAGEICDSKTIAVTFLALRELGLEVNPKSR